MKLTIAQRVAATVAAGTMLVGVGATVASAAPAPKDRGAAVDERLAKLDCADADKAKAKIEERAAEVTANIPQRITKLTEFQAEAADAGRERLADRVQRRIDRLQERLDKLPGAVEQAKEKIDEKCSTTG